MPYTTWKTLPALAPDYLYPWLTDRSSMTARLIQHFPDFRVELLESGLKRSHKDEVHALNLPLQNLAYTREVLLCSHHQPLIYAHSATHPKWLKTHFPYLYHQGTRSLGATLFANKKIHRGPLAIAKILPGHPLHHKIQARSAILHAYLWARRSCFTYGPATLLVTEVFLPSFVQQLKAR